MIRAHPSKYELWAQVGDGEADHGFWGRPEDMPESLRVSLTPYK
jgi:hypothetical protein